MKSKHKVKDFCLFGLPGLFCFFAVVIIPFIYGVYLTFTDWDGVSSEKHFIWFENFKGVIRDGEFWTSLLLTFKYVIVVVILVNVIAFVIAYLLTRGIKGQNFFRAGFFVPNLIGGIVLGYVWKFVFNRALVAIGESLSIGALSTSWLATSGGAMACLIIVAVWQYAGYMMLIYVAGFMSVSNDVLEAAKIDGCTDFQTIVHISVPLMVSSFVQCLFLTITRCFMVYDVNLSLTKGEPFNSSVMAAMHVYNQAFTYKNYGTGQAEALVLFIVCAVIGVLQVYIGKKAEVSA